MTCQQTEIRSFACCTLLWTVYLLPFLATVPCLPLHFIFPSGLHMGSGLRGDRLPGRGVPPVPEHERGRAGGLQDQDGGVRPEGAGPGSPVGPRLYCHFRQPHIPRSGLGQGDRRPDRRLQGQHGPQQWIPGAPGRVHETILSRGRGRAPLLYWGSSSEHFQWLWRD